MMQDDPKRPWKAVAAAVVAGAGVLLTYREVLPLWITISAAVISAGAATYAIRNPKV